jgi:hypothetical protein
MRHHFAAMSGDQHFVIDQAVTVDFMGGWPATMGEELLAALSDTLAATVAPSASSATKYPRHWTPGPVSMRQSSRPITH